MSSVPVDPVRLAEAVRAACIREALAAYEDAGFRGLCEEGRWEAAIGALRALDALDLVREIERADPGPG